MPAYISVFDTNVYYNLNVDRAARTKALERREGVVGFASAWVVLELLSHLADSEDPKYPKCEDAIRALAEHVQLWNGATYIPFMGSPRDALSDELFGWRDPKLRQLSDGLGDAVLRVARGPEYRDAEFANFCGEVKAFLGAEQRRFGTSIRSVVEQLETVRDDQGLPLTEGGRAKAHHAFVREHGELYAAESIAMAIAARSGREISGDELNRCARRVIEVIPVAVHFWKDELFRFAGQGADPTKPENSNSLWDLELAAIACRGAHLADYRQFGSATPRLVTNERRIQRAAVSAGAPELVLGMTAYLECLQRSP